MMRASYPGLLLYAVGDIAPDRDDPRECFALAESDLRMDRAHAESKGFKAIQGLPARYEIDGDRVLVLDPEPP